MEETNGEVSVVMKAQSSEDLLDDVTLTAEEKTGELRGGAISNIANFDKKPRIRCSSVCEDKIPKGLIEEVIMDDDFTEDTSIFDSRLSPIRPVVQKCVVDSKDDAEHWIETQGKTYEELVSGISAIFEPRGLANVFDGDFAKTTAMHGNIVSSTPDLALLKRDKFKTLFDVKNSEVETSMSNYVSSSSSFPGLCTDSVVVGQAGRFKDMDVSTEAAETDSCIQEEVSDEGLDVLGLDDFTTSVDSDCLSFVTVDECESMSEHEDSLENNTLVDSVSNKLEHYHGKKHIRASNSDFENTVIYSNHETSETVVRDENEQKSVPAAGYSNLSDTAQHEILGVSEFTTFVDSDCLSLVTVDECESMSEHEDSLENNTLVDSVSNKLEHNHGKKHIRAFNSDFENTVIYSNHETSETVVRDENEQKSVPAAGYSNLSDTAQHEILGVSEFTTFVDSDCLSLVTVDECESMSEHEDSLENNTLVDSVSNKLEHNHGKKHIRAFNSDFENTVIYSNHETSETVVRDENEQKSVPAAGYSNLSDTAQHEILGVSEFTTFVDSDCLSLVTVDECESMSEHEDSLENNTLVDSVSNKLEHYHGKKHIRASNSDFENTVIYSNHETSETVVRDENEQKSVPAAGYSNLSDTAQHEILGVSHKSTVKTSEKENPKISQFSVLPTTKCNPTMIQVDKLLTLSTNSTPTLSREGKNDNVSKSQIPVCSPAFAKTSEKTQKAPEVASSPDFTKTSAGMLKVSEVFSSAHSKMSEKTQKAPEVGFKDSVRPYSAVSSDVKRPCPPAEKVSPKLAEDQTHVSSVQEGTKAAATNKPCTVTPDVITVKRSLELISEDRFIRSTETQYVSEDNVLIQQVKKRWGSNGIPSPEINLTFGNYWRRNQQSSVQLRRKALLEGCFRLPPLVEIIESKECASIKEVSGSKRKCRDNVVLDASNGYRWDGKRARYDQPIGTSPGQVSASIKQEIEKLEQNYRHQRNETFRKEDKEKRRLFVQHQLQEEKLVSQHEKEMQALCACSYRSGDLQGRFMYLHQKHQYLLNGLQESYQNNVSRVTYLSKKKVSAQRKSYFEISEQLQQLLNKEQNKSAEYNKQDVNYKMMNLVKAPCRSNNQKRSWVQVCLPVDVGSAIILEDLIYEAFYLF